MLELLKNRSFAPRGKYEEVELVIDEGLQGYLEEYNGGYYFDNSLHLYVINAEDKWNDFEEVNDLLHKEYGLISENIVFFGQDIFGNQFGVRKENGGVVHFNIETGDVDVLAKDFDSWLGVLLSDLDYFTGRELVNSLDRVKVKDLTLGFRLCPKYPFVMGGAYETSNLYLKYYSELLAYQASIAKQIINLEDGQRVSLDIK